MVYGTLDIQFVGEARKNHPAIDFFFQDGKTKVPYQDIEAGKYDKYIAEIDWKVFDEELHINFYFGRLITNLNEIIIYSEKEAEMFIKKLEKGGLLHGENQPKSIRTS